MLKNRYFLLTIPLLFIILWPLPAFGLVIDGPSLNVPERGWRDCGLVIRAEADVMLVSVRFPNQGMADSIQLWRDSDSALLVSIPVPPGNLDFTGRINYPLTAGETYRLVATTPNNKYFGFPGMFRFPVSNPEITILGSYWWNLDYFFWFSFNDITTQLNITVLEAVIDIKPGSDTNSINLKSKGLVPVAVLTTEAFDALSIDAGSVIFGGAHAVKYQIEDVNFDGKYDVLFFFKTAALSELTAGSTEAALTGTVAGTPFSGADTVRVVPAK